MNGVVIPGFDRENLPAQASMPQEIHIVHGLWQVQGLQPKRKDSEVVGCDFLLSSRRGQSLAGTELRNAALKGMLGRIFLFLCSFQAKAQITVMEEGCKMGNTDGELRGVLVWGSGFFIRWHLLIQTGFTKMKKQS